MPTATVQSIVSKPAKTNGSDPIWIPTQATDTTLRTTFSFDTLEETLDAFARGEAVVVMDDERRENEGDIIISASQCSVQAMAWMIKHTRYEFHALILSFFMSILAVISAFLFQRSVLTTSKSP